MMHRHVAGTCGDLRGVFQLILIFMFTGTHSREERKKSPHLPALPADFGPWVEARPPAARASGLDSAHPSDRA
jgi:hypothetical protein